MNEFTELNETDLGAVVGGTDAEPCSLYLRDGAFDLLPSY